jgi:hypothetical protein
MKTVDEVVTALRELPSLIKELDLLPTGIWRARTVFEYPDGGSIDVFVDEVDGRIVLSDLGETHGWLFNLTGERFDSSRSDHQRVLQAGGVRTVGGALVTGTEGPLGLSFVVTSLCLTCVWVAELGIVKTQG